LLLVTACATAAGTADAPRVTHGPVTGDVTATSAVVWARADRPGRMHLNLRAEEGTHEIEAVVPVFRGEDWTGKFELRGLRPDTSYRVSVWIRSAAGQVASPEVAGRFRTAPADHERAPVRVALGGDLAGQNVCRDAREGFPVFRAIAAWEPDLFVGLGDMIYADGICAPVGLYGNPQVPGEFGPAASLASYWAHWRYSREDDGFRELLAGTPYVAIWDDHEVVNDFGPHADTRANPPYTAGEHLMPLGLAAFLDYNPVPERDVLPGRLYRSLRWGRHLELFVLDTRQYRDPARDPDDADDPKSLLGAEQRAWLKDGLAASDATWKLVITSVPLAIPTGHPERRDGWANFRQEGGFERELLEILRSLRDAGVGDTVWISADVHFAAVFRHVPFSEAPEFRIHELVTGPLQAGLFGHARFDTTLGSERLFYFGPEDYSRVSEYEQARGWFNFAALEVDPHGSLTLRLVNVDGVPVFEATLAPHSP
jgi:alkaline phosphatase D